MPVTQIQNYLRPPDLGEAWSLLTEGGASARILSGGTDLAIHCPPEIHTLIDLAEVGIGGVEDTPDGGIRLGATATLSEVTEHPTAARYLGGVIPEMMVHVGSPLLRNAAAVGGQVARGRLSDLVPVLLALDATVVIYDGASRELSLETYYRDEHHRRPHILTAVLIPPEPPGAAAYLRFARSAFDHALVGVACRVEPAGGLAGHRVVVAQAPGIGARVTAAEETLVGGATPERIEAAAVAAARTVPTRDDAWAGAAYRTQLVEVLVRRCLTIATTRLEGATA